MITIALPKPVSLNNIYGNAGSGGRKKTPEYKAWCRQADQMIALQPFTSFSGAVRITYHVGEVGVGTMDIGNTEKAMTDALVRAGIIGDDSRQYLRSICVHWIPGMAGSLAVVRSASEMGDRSAWDVMQLANPRARDLLK